MPLHPEMDRSQMEFFCLEELIPKDHPVRVIEAFVEGLDLEALGFKVLGKSHEGRPAFGAKSLLKLYLYGYQNGVRSSRKLEAEGGRNVELWWLLGRQQPGYKTIADFRKDNRSAFKGVFRQLVSLMRDWDLVGGKTLAIDSTKIRAQNSKKHLPRRQAGNFNKEKIDRQIAYIDGRLEEFFEEMDRLDEEDDKGADTKEAWAVISEKVQTQMDRRDKYEKLGRELEQSGQKQISTTDPDARALVLHRNIVEVGYAIQTVVDEKHKLIVHNETTNENDLNALSKQAAEGKEACQTDQVDVLADAGYHTGREIASCEKEQVTTYVAAGKHAPQTGEAYTTDKFEYVAQGNYYICPQGYELHTNGNWYERKNTRSSKGEVQYRIQQFRTPACATCSARSKCTKSKNGRLIERTEYQDAVDRNDARMKTNWSYYRKRQELVEHPYGTIKRQWGFTYTLLKTLPKVQAESDLIFTCYNLKRCVNLLGLQEILERLKAVLSLILGNLRHLKKSQESIFTSFAFLSFFGGNIRREDVF